MAERFNYHRILASLFLLSVFLLSILKIEDTDAWMHLNFGKLIWHLKGFPDREPFLYTMLDKPFIYSSWLFGLIYYLSCLAFNIYGINPANSFSNVISDRLFHALILLGQLRKKK